MKELIAANIHKGKVNKAKIILTKEELKKFGVSKKTVKLFNKKFFNYLSTLKYDSKRKSKTSIAESDPFYTIVEILLKYIN